MLPVETQDTDLPDQKIAEILDRIRATFITKGFDGASMQELAKSAGMSAGNFYRYFPSKAAIIEALISRDLKSVLEDFSVVTLSGNPLENLRNIVSKRVQMPAADQDARLWAEIEAVASRDSGIGEIGQRMQGEIYNQLLLAFARIGGRSTDYMREHHAHCADALMILVKGAAIRACRPAAPADPAALHALIMRLFDTILSDIAALSEARTVPMSQNPTES